MLKSNKNTPSFGKYSSKIKRVNIPIPSFEYVHKSWLSGHIGTATPGFMIGRDRIIEKLKTWLIKEKSNGGSYLITGYRGMGKTSFVDRVLYELVGEASFWTNLVGFLAFAIIGFSFYCLSYAKCGCKVAFVNGIICCSLLLLIICKQYLLKEKFKKYKYRIKAGLRFTYRHKKMYHLWDFLKTMKGMWTGLEAKDWDRINNLVYGSNVTEKRYSHICVNVNLGQEILDERSILCVLTAELYDKYRAYILSPIANVEMWIVYVITIIFPISFQNKTLEVLGKLPDCLLSADYKCIVIGLITLMAFIIAAWHQLRVLLSLRILRKRIDAEMKTSHGIKVKHDKTDLGSSMEYSYPIANIRDIESQLIAILDRIERFPVHPTFYFVFDELDKIETSIQQNDDTLPEYSNEKYLSTGGTSRKRKFMVMHLLANMKYFTSTAKAKFIFIAGREMYDGYLADLTDRESAISSLFNGVIYVDSFCKNEKSDKDVMYNTETFIARQLIPKEFIADKVMDRFIECKLKNKTYTNIDINLKLYFEYLTLVYTDYVLDSKLPEEKRQQFFDASRACIDKTIGLLYHFTVYLYHVSNGSPKKMRMNFENRIRPLRNKGEFMLTKKKLMDRSPLEGEDIDIYIPERCKYLLSFGEKEQRIIGFIHYISFPVNQIITDANQFGDKLLVAACFLINHLYKHHSGGFSWRNIEQTPELLEVYKIPEFRGFINSILTYLLQTHIIQIPCGLYQFKFRKQISEEISLASKVSEEVSAIFNFTLDESQSVKRHYMEIQRKHLSTLKEEKISSPHSVAGLHHILADLYMADEEYNQAIFEYQMALGALNQMNTTNEDSHQATFTLAYIRNMLKLGSAFEKRKTYASAYNTYNEIIDRLFRFREFDEKKFGLNYVVTPTENWPYQDAILYNEGLKIKTNLADNDKKELIRNVIPVHMSDIKRLHKLAYKTKGRNMISDFSHQMTPEKHTVIQRLAMLEDTQIVYQALLAKLFINEKIELGGITRSNLNMIEGEYQYIHLTTNEKEKFLISTDFFRRLGDIMFYKNGLIGFNFNNSDKETELEESFVDSLYYWAFNIETEIADYCTEHKCHELRGDMLTNARSLNANNFKNFQKIGIQNKGTTTEEARSPIDESMADFWETRIDRLKKLPLEDIEKCNRTRKEMWVKKRTMPCLACKYYNRSLRIIMGNLFGIETEVLKPDASQKKESKTITLLRLIVINGSAKSMRQNHMIQFAEVMDCLGNTILSCSNFEKDHISSKFLSQFLHDVHIMNRKMDETMDVKDFILLNDAQLDLSKLETCILYFWEASICFRYGRDQKKAFGSLKKILRVIQNYLRVAGRTVEMEQRAKCQIVIGEFLNEIKHRIIKQALICLFSHYNFINTVEIQKLKWIFYTQMYENISLNRLSLFPDVEEIMLIYYEIIRLCIVDHELFEMGNKELEEVRTNIYAYSKENMASIGFTWNNIEERNDDFNNRLVGIYNNLSMGSLRHESTVYERVLSLRMKMILNRHILFLAFPDMESVWKGTNPDKNAYTRIFIDKLTKKENMNEKDHPWKKFFPDEQFCDDAGYNHLYLLEFLIQDSIYCLTLILETITPYTTTTLFTHSFIGGIYRSLNKWNVLFDALFWYYKFFDERNPLPEIYKYSDMRREKLLAKYDERIKQKNNSYCGKMCHLYNSKNDSQMWQNMCPYYSTIGCDAKANYFEMNKQILLNLLGDEKIKELAKTYHEVWECNNLSDRFFASILNGINKHNIQYTLTNYSGEMALKSYRNAIEVHKEGRAYKEMISRMYYLDDDLKNDTIQFDLAIERFKINSNHIDTSIESVKKGLNVTLYDVESVCTDNETRATLHRRFPDLFWNVDKNNISDFLNR